MHMKKIYMMRSNKGESMSSRGLQSLLFLGVFGVFALVFSPLYQLLGPTAGACVAMPMLISSWVLGFWRGLIAGLLAMPFVTLLYNLAGYTCWAVIVTIGSWPGFLVTLFMSAAVGVYAGRGDAPHNTQHASHSTDGKHAR